MVTSSSFPSLFTALHAYFPKSSGSINFILRLNVIVFLFSVYSST